MRNDIDLNELVFPIDTTMSEVLQKLDQCGGQVAVVCCPEGRMVGILTGGDIKRLAIKGETLAQPIENIMTKEFDFGVVTDTEAVNRAKLVELEREYLPILNESGILVCLMTESSMIFHADLCSDVQVFILAGGVGQRLRPLTQDMPKPMIDIGGKPMLLRLIERLRNIGLRNITLSINYKKQVIKDYFGDGGKFGVCISYVEESEPLGTAGSLALAKMSGPGKVLIINGDILTSFDFRQILEFHKRVGAEVIVGVRNFVVGVPFGVISAEGDRIVSIEEKPCYSYPICAAIYSIDKELIKQKLKARRIDMPEFLENLIEDGCLVRRFLVTNDWLDVGTQDSLNIARAQFSG